MKPLSMLFALAVLSMASTVQAQEPPPPTPWHSMVIETWEAQSTGSGATPMQAVDAATSMRETMIAIFIAGKNGPHSEYFYWRRSVTSVGETRQNADGTYTCVQDFTLFYAHWEVIQPQPDN